MELILIACSGKKTEGGTIEYHDSNLPNFMSLTTYQDLLSHRLMLAEELNLPFAQDVGSDVNNGHILFEPAFKRYTGRVYERSNLQGLYPKANNFKVTIVSAFYGILDAANSIRNYDLMMDTRIFTRQKVNSFWKKQNLGKKLMEYIFNLRPTKIHDLLPISYRKALSPWGGEIFNQSNIFYKLYEYPGQGNGALWKRGDDLRTIFQG